MSGRQVTSDHAFRAAAALQEGKLAPNSIAKRLYPEEFANPATRAAATMRARRAVELAFREGILRVRPRVDAEAGAALEEWLDSRGTKCRVVVINDYGIAPALRRAVAAVGAATVSRTIAELSEGIAKGSSSGLCVANAGGRTLAHVTQSLQAEVSVAQRSSDLLFLSLNRATKPAEMDISANFLAVRMAEIYGAKHLTAMNHWPQWEDERRYDEALKRIDVLLTSCGTRSGFLMSWLERVDLAIPNQDALAGVVGDVAFVPLDERGGEGRIHPEVERVIRENLDPRPNHDDLQRLARERHVIAFCCPPDHLDEASPATESMAQGADVGNKSRVGAAILENALASTFITTKSLACQIAQYLGADDRRLKQDEELR